MKLRGNLPPGHGAVLFLISAMRCRFIMSSRPDTAGHTKSFDLQDFLLNCSRHKINKKSHCDNIPMAPEKMKEMAQFAQSITQRTLPNVDAGTPS